jgi:virginiamycin B lyase
MNRSGLRSCLAALLTALVVSVGLLGLSSLPAWAAAGTVTEFPTPTRGTPFDITAGPDGNLWFTVGAGEIGRITPGGSITLFRLPGTCGKYLTCAPWGITAGPDGNLWFTEEIGNVIGRITPGGSFSAFRIPTASSRPEGITVGPDGNLWFTEEGGSKIGRITTS